MKDTGRAHPVVDPGTCERNLKAFREACDAIPPTERLSSFHAYLVGALVAVTPAETWDYALNVAANTQRNIVERGPTS